MMCVDFLMSNFSEAFYFEKLRTLKSSLEVPLNTILMIRLAFLILTTNFVCKFRENFEN